MSQIFFLSLISFFASLIDTALGMCYGTLMVPFLLIFDYSPQISVGAVLFSQLIVDILGSITHAKVKNLKKEDLKHAFIVSLPATIFVIGGAFLNIHLSEKITRIYAGAVVLLLGILIMMRIKFKKTSRRLIFISSVAGFNKGFIGGGFGPVIVPGQILLNHNPRSSVAIGDLAEIPVCLVGLLTLIFLGEMKFSSLFLIISFPAAIASFIGPFFTKKTSHQNLEKTVAFLSIFEGATILIKSFS